MLPTPETCGYSFFIRHLLTTPVIFSFAREGREGKLRVHSLQRCRVQKEIEQKSKMHLLTLSLIGLWKLFFASLRWGFTYGTNKRSSEKGSEKNKMLRKNRRNQHHTESLRICHIYDGGEISDIFFFFFGWEILVFLYFMGFGRKKKCLNTKDQISKFPS